MARHLLHLRNTNEGFNRYVKDAAHEALNDPGQRKVLEVTAQSVLKALLLKGGRSSTGLPP